MDNSKFIQKANLVHNNRYSYKKSIYINNHTKVEIICSTHGSFWQTPNSHLRGTGCPSCGGKQKLSTEEFINRSNIKHNFKYTYDRTVYLNGNLDVIITCSIHGDFFQRPTNHLRGSGCPPCGYGRRIWAKN